MTERNRIDLEWYGELPRHRLGLRLQLGPAGPAPLVYPPASILWDSPNRVVVATPLTDEEAMELGETESNSEAEDTETESNSEDEDTNASNSEDDEDTNASNSEDDEDNDEEDETKSDDSVVFLEEIIWVRDD